MTFGGCPWFWIGAACLELDTAFWFIYWSKIKYDYENKSFVYYCRTCFRIKSQRRFGIFGSKSWPLDNTRPDWRTRGAESLQLCREYMKTKIASIIAAVIGSLCIAFAFWMQYVALSLVAALPSAVGAFDSRFFDWPFCAGILFLALACFGFSWHKKHRHDHAA